MTNKQDNFFTTQIPQNHQVQNIQEKAQPLQKQKQTQKLKLLLDEFNRCDNREKGIISLQQAKKIIESHSLGTQHCNQQDILVNSYYKMSLPLFEDSVSFDEFLFILELSQNQYKSAQQQYDHGTKINQVLIDFLKQLYSRFRVLNNYRKKMQKQQNYKQAKKSKLKIQEIRERQLLRRKNLINMLHTRQITYQEEKQKQKFVAFCSYWDQFMINYENQAVQMVNKLKNKHQIEFMEFQNRNRKQLAEKIHYSKRIIQLQTVQKNLVKIQDYEKADRVQAQIEELKNNEILKKQKDDEQVLEIRCSTYRKQQLVAMNNLLQKIQKDRNDQIKKRQIQSQKLVVRSKTIITEINHKHTQALKKIFQALHNINLDIAKVTKKQ